MPHVGSARGQWQATPAQWHGCQVWNEVMQASSER
ncbi:hypothetical protein H4W32_000217 [Actinophytocola algeriensis]|uniref:Uncharacterized protein n=1 Tax=Actinophytocola algeriensis TaxID=1768010 RepID=A0A7W7Q3Q0_9PSEU|nr:hypothetical protein [Actinophytocola algeriensis]MBE1472175.1 hypothetical protein [Actinophytocola algeriensis]